MRTESRSNQAHYVPPIGLHRAKAISTDHMGELLHGRSLPEPIVKREMSSGALEALKNMERADEARRKLEQQTKEKSGMTVSLYTSKASGKLEIVVQTNAQTLDLFTTGLADAIADAVEKIEPERRAEVLGSLLRNALPVAFAIAGYKADRVSESRMLICGAAAPDSSTLLAHSRT